MFTQNFVKIVSETLSPLSSRHFFQDSKQSAYSLFPFAIVWIIIFLEFGITFLQAYVFIVLLTIYFEENLGLSKKTYAAIKNINRLKSNYFIINTKFYNEMFFFFNLKKKKLFNA